MIRVLKSYGKTLILGFTSPIQILYENTGGRGGLYWEFLLICQVWNYDVSQGYVLLISYVNVITDPDGCIVFV